LFLHVVAVNTFFAPVLFQVGFGILTVFFRPRGFGKIYRTAGGFYGISPFKEEKETGHRQQQPPVRNEKNFAPTPPTHPPTRHPPPQNKQTTTPTKRPIQSPLQHP
ncbi:hypothetical protein, partial [Salmonella enterica]|uniref:hypothetical protein n=1 Tax=Salmonella enterica TaxID=28901 RepID=UPI001A7F04BD